MFQCPVESKLHFLPPCQFYIRQERKKKVRDHTEGLVVDKQCDLCTSAGLRIKVLE